MPTNFGSWLGRSANCPDPCGGTGSAVDDSDKCFAHDQESDYIQAVEPDCPTWKNGWKCRAENFVGNVTWLFNKITCAIKNLNERVTALEDENPIMGWNSQDDDGDGIYEIVVTYRDGTTAPFNIEDTDERVTNPRPQDTDGNGINDRVLWDVIDDEGNVVGQEIVPIQEYVDTDTNTFLQRINNLTSGTINLAFGGTYPFRMNNGVTWNLRMPAAPPSGITLVNNGNPIALWSTGEIPVGGLPDTYSANVAAHVPASASGVIIRYYLEVDSSGTAIPVEINIRINGKLAGGTEAGGAQPVTDNSYWAEMAFPRSGNNVTAVVALNYGANPSVYQTRGYLIGYF